MKKNYFTMFTHDRKILVYSFYFIYYQMFSKNGGKRDSEVIKIGEEIKQLTRIKALLSCPPGLP